MSCTEVKVELNSPQESLLNTKKGQNYCKFAVTLIDRLGACFFPVTLSPVNKFCTFDVETLEKMDHCLCETVMPILILSRYAGIIPLIIHHPKSESGQLIGSCHLTFQWKSLSNFISLILITGFIGFLPFAFVEIKNHMKGVFDGTDLYAFTFQLFAMITETTVLLLAGRIFRSRFTEGWTELHRVYNALCGSADDGGHLTRLKVGSYIASALIVLELVIFYLFNVRISHKSAGFYQSCFDTFFWTFVINLTLFIPFVLSTLFLFICLLLRSHFMKISEMLESVMKKRNSPTSFYQGIDSLRVLHEQLCQAVRKFETFFGVQILLTLCTCCFTVIIGAYASIVQSEGLSSSELSGAWATQMYSAGIFIILILVSGQLVTNSAASPAPVLNSLSFTDLDDKGQKSVSAFLHKISSFPIKMTAMNTINISSTFLSSAIPNITTYLLVLMQFKLSLENKSHLTSDGKVVVVGNVTTQNQN